MNIDEARDFIRENHRAVLATYRRDGRPQMSPVSVVLDDQGRPVISTRETAYKTRNLRRDPRVSLCVMSEAFFGKWIQIDGIAELHSLPEAMDSLVQYYRTAMGEHHDWDKYRAAMVGQQRLLLRINIERAGPDRKG